jgi:hypothetical protein
MITLEQKAHAIAALRAAGFNPNETRELLAGPKGLRDEFAGQAMRGLLTMPSEWRGYFSADGAGTTWKVEAVRAAYDLADAMMAQRSAP